MSIILKNIYFKITEFLRVIINFVNDYSKFYMISIIQMKPLNNNNTNMMYKGY